MSNFLTPYSLPEHNTHSYIETSEQASYGWLLNGVLDDQVKDAYQALHNHIQEEGLF